MGSLRIVTTQRRNNMGLPVELWINVFRDVRQSIGVISFGMEAETSMYNEALYVNNLLNFCRVQKGWTAIAQLELFRHIILINDKKALLCFKLLEEKEELRNCIKSVRFGEQYVCGCRSHGETLKKVHNQIMECCPNIHHVSCSSMSIQLEIFRKLLPLHAGPVIDSGTADRKDQFARVESLVWVDPDGIRDQHHTA